MPFPKDYHCPTCGRLRQDIVDSLNKEYIEESGCEHAFTKWVNLGIINKKRTCTLCGEKEFKSISGETCADCANNIPNKSCYTPVGTICGSFAKVSDQYFHIPKKELEDLLAENTRLKACIAKMAIEVYK